MVEAMHEQHPDFFKQHRKNFRYLVLEKEPWIGFIQENITHLEFILVPLIIFAALRNNLTTMFFLSAIPLTGKVSMYPASIKLSVYCWRTVRVS